VTWINLDRYLNRAPYIPSVSDQQLEVFLGTVGPEHMSLEEQRLYAHHQQPLNHNRMEEAG